MHNAQFSAKLLRQACNIWGERGEELVPSPEPVRLCDVVQLCDGFPLGRDISAFFCLLLKYIRVSSRKLKTKRSCFDSEGLTEVGERNAKALRYGKVIQPRGVQSRVLKCILLRYFGQRQQQLVLLHVYWKRLFVCSGGVFMPVSNNLCIKPEHESSDTDCIWKDEWKGAYAYFSVGI